jgi:hypothetical protein
MAERPRIQATRNAQEKPRPVLRTRAAAAKMAGGSTDRPSSAPPGSGKGFGLAMQGIGDFITAASHNLSHGDGVSAMDKGMDAMTRRVSGN